MAVPTLARTLASGPQHWMELCRQAESLGIHSVWTGDTAGADAFVDAAYAVSATRALSVGIGVALPTRSPLQTASAAAALATPGRRLILGLGAGNAALNEGAHGIEYGPVVARLTDFVECVTAILRAPLGEPVELSQRHARVRGRGFGVDAEQLRIVLGAYGPAMTALAGTITDGLLVHLLTPRSKIRDHLAAAKSNHVGSTFLRAAGILISAHEDEAEAMARARTVLSTVLGLPRFASRLDEIAPGTDLRRLDDALVREFVIVSTPARLLDDVEEFAEADILIPVPISLFMAAGRLSDETREAVLAGLLRRATHAAAHD